MTEVEAAFVTGWLAPLFILVAFYALSRGEK